MCSGASYITYGHPSLLKILAIQTLSDIGFSWGAGNEVGRNVSRSACVVQNTRHIYTVDICYGAVAMVHYTLGITLTQ